MALAVLIFSESFGIKCMPEVVSNDIYFFLIDDAEMMLTKMEPQQKKIRLSLRDTRRAFTNDNEDGYVTKICKLLLYPNLTIRCQKVENGLPQTNSKLLDSKFDLLKN